MSSKSHSPIHVAMLTDAWFPASEDGPGEFTGMQVHIRQLRQNLEKNFPIKVELFFPANPNFIIRSLWFIIVIIQIANYHRRHPIDILHAQGAISIIPAKILSKLLGIPLVQTIHRFSHLDHKGIHPQKIIESLTLTKIPVTAQITTSAMFTRFSNRNQNIHTIPNGIDIAEFNRVKVKKFLHPTIIWVGRDDPTKGLEYLRQAITRVRKVFPQLQAELVSGGRLTGKELIKHYKKSHLFVLPSLVETQPISLLEAWAAKLPVVVTKVGDNAHMVKHNVTGLLVEPANVKQLTQAILKILRAKTTHDRLAQAGYQNAKQHYSWKQVAKQTHQVYLQILNT